MKKIIFSDLYTCNMRFNLYIVMLLSILATVACVVPVKLLWKQQKIKPRMRLRRPRLSALPCQSNIFKTCKIIQ